jgi:hypothetical protein
LHSSRRTSVLSSTMRLALRVLLDALNQLVSRETISVVFGPQSEPHGKKNL